MNSDFLRALLARVEAPLLDFKTSFCESTESGAAELTKDIMAMGNAIPIGSPENGYVLIGVAEAGDHTGQALGFAPERWITDANLHQKVRALLNRCPSFLWYTIDFDGACVGVLEISPGGRPFFPLRDKGVLKRHVPLVRVGSSTDVASPDQVVEWVRGDRGEPLKVLELQKLHAELRVRGELAPAGSSVGGDTDLTLNFHLSNEGLAPFELTSVMATWQLEPSMLQAALHQVGLPMIDVPERMFGRVAFRNEMLRPKDIAHVQFMLTRSELTEHFLPVLQSRDSGGADPELLLPVIFASAIGRGECNFRGLVDGNQGAAAHELRWPTWPPA